MAIGQTLQLIAGHLQLLGYQTQFDREGVQVTHPSRPHFRMYESAVGVVFLYTFGVGQAVASDLAGFLSFLNTINLQCVVGRFSYDAARTSLWVTALHSICYERTEFGTF